MDDGKKLKIASLLPSATDIVLTLGLEESLVAITHECVVPENSAAVIVTKDGVISSSSSQGEIHDRVVASSRSRNEGNDDNSVPSLYPVDYEKLKELLTAASADKNSKRVIFTQDLCSVCAPSSAEINRLNLFQETMVVSLTPHCVADIADNIVRAGSVCNVPQQYVQTIASEFLGNFETLRSVVESNRDAQQPRPKALLFEWLDPPFDGGHWITELIRYAGLEPALSKNAGEKSVAVSWRQMEEISVDLVLVACCGLNLERNLVDAKKAANKLKKCKAPVFCANGDQYFAKPGPRILHGAIILALAGYSNQPQVTQAVKALPFFNPCILVDGYQQLVLSSDSPDETKIPDIEDFDARHREACSNGEMSYTDPSTGYMVMSELAHRKRGKCCGSGCRHCPYNHENIRDNRTAKIQQPALLYIPESDDNDWCSSSLKHGKIRIVFHSGGKDSFLATRAMVQEAQKTPFGMALMTTFDASSRKIAHQDVSIEDVVRQAQHLGLTLIGVPMHRGSKEGYVSRVRRGIQALVRHVGEDTVDALVFGDLHLEHIVEWRESQLSTLGYRLLYPLLRKPYTELAADLAASGVPCLVSASTVEQVEVGQEYGPAFRELLPETVDAFGENGEFHTLAQVWKVNRRVALGL